MATGAYPVAPNSHCVLSQSPPCICPICWIRDRITDSGQASGVVIHKEELKLNIVGFRRADSVSDRFDDAIAVFCKLLDGKNRAAFNGKACTRAVKELAS